MAKFLFYDDQIINILLKEEKPSGGAAVQAYGWIQGLLALGHEVYIITDMSRTGTLKEECKAIKFIPGYDSTKGIRWFRWIYYRIPYLYRELKKAKPDYLYKGIPSWHSFVIGLVCQRLNIKFIQRISNDFLVDKRFLKNHSKANWAFQNMGMRLSNYILCQNEYQFDKIQKQFPLKPVKKISNPIYLSNNLVENRSDYRNYIAWLGLFQYQKNLKLLYEIASKLPQQKFLIAGKESINIDADTLYYLDKLKELPNVSFYGFIKRDQVLPFLAKAKFLLNTSHYEGFSNTFLEAMVIGTPILTSVNVNPDSIISDFNLGIVYENANDLLAKLSVVSPEGYKQMSDNVLEYVAAKHDYRPLTKELVGFLNDN
ncbi:glycosyltransferase family 4 protein [Pontibacter sp. FD36]|uniref:glycosyltransferase family 4 protein n=1 Tax=Pontibacter sp. FD36 TaxID=2789860 RepID=UPI0018AC6262|nr:glycosyltransferase family 4 protein [Pontibacter sp. FD36]MBF8964681.1 glycosyltransferase family 4 protein [Pontibacter sp. FD36]